MAQIRKDFITKLPPEILVMILNEIMESNELACLTGLHRLALANRHHYEQMSQCLYHYSARYLGRAFLTSTNQIRRLKSVFQPWTRQ